MPSLRDDSELLRRYRSGRPMGRECFLAGMAILTFVLWYFDFTLYPSPSLAGLAWGLLIGAIFSYTMRVSRR